MLCIVRTRHRETFISEFRTKQFGNKFGGIRDALFLWRTTLVGRFRFSGRVFISENFPVMSAIFHGQLRRPLLFPFSARGAWLILIFNIPTYPPFAISGRGKKNKKKSNAHRTTVFHNPLDRTPSETPSAFSAVVNSVLRTTCVSKMRNIRTTILKGRGRGRSESFVVRRRNRIENREPVPGSEGPLETPVSISPPTAYIEAESSLHARKARDWRTMSSVCQHLTRAHARRGSERVERGRFSTTHFSLPGIKFHICMRSSLEKLRGWEWSSSCYLFGRVMWSRGIELLSFWWSWYTLIKLTSERPLCRCGVALTEPEGGSPREDTRKSSKTKGVITENHMCMCTHSCYSILYTNSTILR